MSDAPRTPPDRPRLRDRQGPTGLTVYCGECSVGRIYETRGRPDSLRWCVVAGPSTVRTSDQLVSLEGVGEAGALKPYACAQNQMLRSARKNPSDSKQATRPLRKQASSLEGTTNF